MRPSIPLPFMRTQPRGIAMVEVLIAIVIFAFGLLALAGLQVAALKYQKGAWSRSGAAMLTTDIAERVRANMAGAVAGNYTLTGSYATRVATLPTASTCDARTTTCTIAEIAANDIAAWARLLAADMPGGAGTLTGNAVNGFTATVMWNDKDARNADGTAIQSPICAAGTASTQPVCCPTGTPAGIRCINATFLP